MWATGWFRYLHKLQNEREGLTLVEVLVAMLLLSVGILTCLSLLAAGVRVNAVNRDKSAALNLAEQRMEFWKRQDLSAWNLAGTADRVELENSPEGRYRIRVTAAPAQAGPGLAEVVVTVSWDEGAPGQTRDVRLATVRRY